MTAKVIPFPIGVRTVFSEPERETMLKETEPSALVEWIERTLWQGSAVARLTAVRPTNGDVKCWICWLQQRHDSWKPVVQRALSACHSYITPEPARA